MGSWGWRSEQLIRNKPITKYTDIFSLGCIFAFIVSKGQHPFGEP